MRLRFEADALHDLDSIYHFIAERDGDARAERVIAAIEAMCRDIALQPSWGEMHPHLPDIRRRFVRRTDHYVYYATDMAADAVIILHVDSARQRRRAGW